MIEYRGYLIGEETHNGRTHTIIIPPSGDAWISYYTNPESEIDDLIDEKECPEETCERTEEWRRRQWELI